MQTYSLFDVSAGWQNASYLAEVVSVNDPQHLSRVQIRLLSFDGVGEQDAPLWARVAVPFAGAHRGAFLLPDVGDEVMVSFLNGDPRFPVVMGGLWNGAAPAPETLGGSGEHIDRWTIVGKAGTRIAIVEERDGAATICFQTPGGVEGKLTDESGGAITFTGAGTTITLNTQGVTVNTPAQVKIKASQVEIEAGNVSVKSEVALFSNIVECQTLRATTVISQTYTPGAGNVW
ncbi:MAG TPA: phage baseplate assembly protein V [Blastocatellia bacterium]|nr:phage baseplate assembly protein V [Blastocatellia bacterium]